MASVDAHDHDPTGVDLPVSQRTFDAVVSVLSLLLVVGVALDFRAHANGISFAEEGFFTPQHVFFYSAFLGVAATLSVGTLTRRRAGRDWLRAVPPGYGLAVLGVLIFGFGGVGDFFWHSAFGFEQGFEALVSPSHVALASGAVLFLAAPMVAADRRSAATGSLLGSLPVVVSMTLVFTILGLFGGFVNPLYRPYPAFEYYSMQPVVTMLVAFPLLYLGAIAYLRRRFEPIPGAFTAIFGLSALAITQVQGYMALVVPAVLAGIVADVLVASTTPFDAERTGWVRVLTATVPVSFVTAYFAVVELQWGIAHPTLQDGVVKWSVHVVVGAVVLAALAGLLFSTVVSTSRDAATAPDGDVDHEP